MRLRSARRTMCSRWAAFAARVFSSPPSSCPTSSTRVGSSKTRARVPRGSFSSMVKGLRDDASTSWSSDRAAAMLKPGVEVWHWPLTETPTYLFPPGDHEVRLKWQHARQVTCTAPEKAGIQLHYPLQASVQGSALYSKVECRASRVPQLQRFAALHVPDRASPRVSSGCSGDRTTPRVFLLAITCVGRAHRITCTSWRLLQQGHAAGML